MKIIKSLSGLDTGTLSSAGEIPLPDWNLIASSSAAASWGLVEDDRLYAFCSVWLENTPAYEDMNSCTLGHFFATDCDSGKTILEHAFASLRRHSMRYVIGPMNGNTWQSYRFISADSDYPGFFMEPKSVKMWPDLFIQSGFSPIAEYSSSLSEEPDYQDNSIDRIEARIKQHGLVMRPFKLDRSEEELGRVHRLSLTSFSRNFLYTDINRDEFMQLYCKILPYVVPEFFQLVEDEGELVAYIFAIPDYAQKMRGEPIDTLIIKTVARTPGRKYAGIGNYLVHTIHQLAMKQGFRKIIHALMHDNNISKTISDKSALTIRKYTLFGREL